jgi:tetrahydromethanopterin S-methyltransferase subunit B
MTGKNLLRDNPTDRRRARNSYILPSLNFLAAACAAVVLTACGGGDGSDSGSSSSTEAARGAKRVPTAPAESTQVADAIFDGSGNLNAAEYVAIASDYSGDKAMAYRYGASNSAAAAVHTYWKPEDKTFYPHGNTCYQQEFPGSGMDTSTSIVYQLGDIDCARNDYGSNMGDVIFRSDVASDPGVTPLLTLDLSAGTIAEKPQTAWVFGNATTNPQLNNHVAANGGVMPTQPIAMGRCSEHDCAQSLVAFQNGLIASVGMNTASHSASVKLPEGKVPTAIAITSNSEFALVTIWDTKNLKGQVAVIALGSLADGSQVGGPYDSSDMSWHGLYPGLRNMSNFVFMKLLGFVDLPDMKAPTEISAVTDFSTMQDNTTQGWLRDPVGGGGASLGLAAATPGLSEANQKSFAAGGVNANLISRSGVAAVISKSEKKVVFLDLKPLFDKVNNTYFEGSFSDLQNTLNNTGLEESQWPQTFAVDNYAPTIVKTMSLAEKPTAVKVSILANPGQAWVATEDGTLHAISVAGVQSGTNLDPSLIQEVTSLQVGKNPTSITHNVNRDAFGNSNTKIWVVSRGEQKVSLVDMATKTIEKTLQDSRIVDPISVSETQQSPLLTSVISLTDYAGKQVLNYRYAPISLQGGNTPMNIGVGQSGNDEFEFGGAYAVAGKPFNFTQSNVP